MEEPKIMRYETQIQLVPSSMKKLNKQFALVDILLCYHGENRNYTSISKQVIESALPSLYGIPIVGEYIYLDDGSQDFGSHGGKIIISDDGIKFEDTTKPYGFVTKDAVDTASWVTVTEKDGHTQHEYLQLKGCIVWSDRYEEVTKLLDENYGQSMEIQISKGHYNDDHYFVVEDFIFSAACILGSHTDGSDVIPCFESACIGRHYELSSFKKEYEHMLNEYKKTQVNNTNSEGVHKMELTKFVEALSQYKVDDTDNSRYAVLSATDEKVYVLDLVDYKPYAFDYAVTEGETPELVIDIDSKCEMSLSACPKIEEEGFTEFSISDAIEAAAHEKSESLLADCSANLEAAFNEKINEIKASYEALKAEYEKDAAELARYRADEEARKEQEHRDAVDNVINEFAKKLGKVPEFLIYKARLDYNKSIDEIQKDLTLMAGKSIMENQTKQNFSYNPTTTKLNGKSQNDRMTNRYGHLLDKFQK